MEQDAPALFRTIKITWNAISDLLINPFLRYFDPSGNTERHFALLALKMGRDVTLDNIELDFATKPISESIVEMDDGYEQLISCDRR